MGNGLFSSSKLNGGVSFRQNPRTASGVDSAFQDNDDDDYFDDQNVVETFPSASKSPKDANTNNIRRAISYTSIKQRWKFRSSFRSSFRMTNGIRNLNQQKLDIDDLEQLSRETQLNRRTIDTIYYEFKRACDNQKLSVVPNQNGTTEVPPTSTPESPKYASIDKRAFLCLYSSLREEPEEKISRIAELTFESLPKDSLARVQFKDFLVRFAKITKGSIREKLECTYEIYDLKKKGFVEVSDVKRVMDAMLPKMEAHNPNEAEVLTKNCMKLLDPRRTGKISRGDFIEQLVDIYSLRSIMCPYN